MLLDSPGHCDQHRREVFKEQRGRMDEQAKERQRFYQRKVWKDARALQMQREPLCKQCRRHHRLVAAEVVDHIVPIDHGGSMLEPSNLQSLCRQCHNAKTRRDTRPSKG